MSGIQVSPASELPDPPPEGSDAGVVSATDSAPPVDAPAQDAAPPTEGEPVAAEPAKKPEDEGARFASLARLRSQALKQRRAAQAEHARIAQERQRLEAEAARIRQEEDDLRRDPMGWAQRRVTGDDFARGLKPAATAEERIAQLEQQLAESQRAAKERELQAERARVEQSIHVQAEGFATWLDKQEAYPAAASLLASDQHREEVLETWKHMQRTIAKSGYSYTNEEIADVLEKFSRPRLEAIVTSFTQRSKRTPATATQRSAATGTNDAGTPRTLSSSLASARATVQKPREQMTDEEREADMVREYERLSSARG